MPEQGTGVCRVSVLLSVSFRAILGPFIPFGRVLLFGRAWPFFRAAVTGGELRLCLVLARHAELVGALPQLAERHRLQLLRLLLLRLWQRLLLRLFLGGACCAGAGLLHADAAHIFYPWLV